MKYFQAAEGAAKGTPESAAAYDDSFDTDDEKPDQAITADQATYRPFSLPKGEWFDPALDFREPEGEAITNAILTLLVPVEQRIRRRRAVDDTHYRMLLRKMLANGLRCHFHRSPPLVAYSRRTSSYHDGPQWLSGRSISRVADLLLRAEFIETDIGEPGIASTYRVSQRLCEVALTCGVAKESLTHFLPSQRLIRVRNGNYETPYLTFEPTAESLEWAVLLDAYNGFIASQNIALNLPLVELDDLLTRLNSDRRNGLPRLTSPEFFRSSLYRQFCHGSFDHGGRLYGGWWINTPSQLRRQITINGQPTIERDYSGCAIRMLYHEKGIAYEDDPYWLEPVAACETENGLPPGYFREGIKAIMQALINGDLDGKPERARLKQFSFKPYFSRPAIREMIERKHEAVADQIGSGAGKRLQRKDSDLALAIISAGREKGIPILPVHDSFIVMKDDEKEIINLMNNEYFSLFGVYPVIK
jgi:hypothetical protein